MDGALILCRFAQFAAATLLWGACSLRAGAFPPALMRASVSTAVRFGRLAASVNLLAALGWLAAEAALVGGGPQDSINPDVLTALLTASRFGHVWLVHLVLAVALLLATFSDRPIWIAGMAGLNLASLAMIGHAVLPAGYLGFAHQGISVLHLLAAGFWVGGLAVILALLSAKSLAEEAGPVLRSFSRWGHLAVATVFATGFAKSVLILTAHGGFDLAWDYLGLLGLKLAAVVVMLSLALVNRYRFVPKLATGDRAVVLRDLRRGTMAELVLVVVVLASVSIFATWSPFADV